MIPSGIEPATYRFVKKMSTDDLWNDVDGKTEVSEEHSVSVSLYSLQISHGQTWDRTWAPRFEAGD